MTIMCKKSFKDTIESWFKTSEIEIFLGANQNIALIKIGCFNAEIKETPAGCTGYIKVGKCRIYCTPDEENIPLALCLSYVVAFIISQVNSVEQVVCSNKKANQITYQVT
jgi:hypothetical protein